MKAQKTLFSILILLFLVIPNHKAVHAQTAIKKSFPQFLFSDFIKGTVKMKAGDVHTTYLNYNMVDEEFVYLQDNQIMALIELEKIDTITVINRKFVPKDKIFLEVVSQGKTSFYLQNKAKLSPVASNSAYGLNSQVLGPTKVAVVQIGNQVRTTDLPPSTEVTRYPECWITKDGKVYKINTQKQFLKLFPENQDQIKKFIKENKINFSKNDDLIKLCKYCGSSLN